MSIENYYTKEFKRLEFTKQDDGMGTKAKTWSEVPDSDFKGHLEMLSGSERFLDQHTNYFATHRLYCDINTPIVNTSRIVSASGQKYYVVSADKLFNHHTEAIVSELPYE
jgi:LysM repeat protein